MSFHKIGGDTGISATLSIIGAMLSICGAICRISQRKAKKTEQRASQ